MVSAPASCASVSCPPRSVHDKNEKGGGGPVPALDGHVGRYSDLYCGFEHGDPGQFSVHSRYPSTVYILYPGISYPVMVLLVLSEELLEQAEDLVYPDRSYSGNPAGDLCEPLDREGFSLYIVANHPAVFCGDFSAV